MDVVKIGLLGLGNVGCGTWHTLTTNSSSIAARAGVKLEVAGIAVRDVHKRRQVAPPAELLTTDALSLIDDPTIPIIVETIGCPHQDTHIARDFMLRALAAGKHVVTANKEVLAKHGRELGRRRQGRRSLL